MAGTLIAVAEVAVAVAGSFPRTTRGARLADLALPRDRIEDPEADDGGDGERDGVGHGGTADDVRFRKQELDDGHALEEQEQRAEAG